MSDATLRSRAIPWAFPTPSKTGHADSSDAIDLSGRLDGGNVVVVDRDVPARRVEPISRIPQHQAIAKQRGGHEFLALLLSRALP